VDRHLNTDPARYAEEGYFVARGMVPEEDLPGLREDALTCIAETKAKPAYMELKTRHYRDFAAGLHLKRSSVAELLQGPPFRELNALVLGPNVDLRFTSTMTKTRERASALDWHQDAAYGLDPEHVQFSWWIALTDATRENGGLRILPGSHKAGLVNHIPSRLIPSDKEIETVDEAGALDVELAAGDAIALSPFVFHASWPNVSGALRIGLIAGFMLPKTEYLEFEKKASYAYARGGEPRWERIAPES
jgi:hypothetical protein